MQARSSNNNRVRFADKMHLYACDCVVSCKMNCAKGLLCTPIINAKNSKTTEI